MRHRRHRRAARRRRRRPPLEDARGDGRRAAPPRPRRVRPLPRRAAPGSGTRASRSSTSPPASSRSRNEDGTLWIVFNGEIFNYVELRAELVALGHRFRTRSDTEVIVHAYEAWGERRVRALQRPVRGRALGRRARDARPRARPARRPAALPLRARRPPLVRQRGEGDLRRRPVDPARARPGRARRDVHLLDGRAAAVGVPRRHRARAGPRARSSRARGATDRAFWTPRYPRGAGRRVRRARSTRPSERVRAALEEAVAPAHAARRRAGRQLPLGRPRQLARRRARPAREGRAASARSRIRFEDAEYDETPLPARRWRRASGATTTRSSCAARDIAAAFPEVVAHAERPLLRTAPAPLFLLSRLVRDAGHQGRAHRRGRRRDVRRLRPLPRGEGPALLGAAARARRCGRACSSGSTRTSPARRSRSGRWRASSSAAAASAWASPGFAPPDRAGAPRPRCSGSSRRRCARGRARATSSARLLASLPGRVRAAGRPSRRTSTSRCGRCSPGYLLSSQGDRMLMAHSVEGRFPFLDADVVALAERAAGVATSCAGSTRSTC